MYRYIHAGLLVVAGIPVAAGQTLLAGAPEVVVTASRFTESREESPEPMTVIRAEQIRDATARTLPELLSQQAGIQVRDNSGSPDVQVDLRGFGITGDQNTLLLLDGQRLSEVELTPAKWSAIPLSAIERVEILRGAGTVLWGGGASGGVINVVTREPVPGERWAELLLGGGSYSTRDARAGLSVAGQQVALRVNAQHYESDNFRDNNRVELDNGLAEFRYFDAQRSIALKLGADDQKLGLPGARTEAQIATNPRGATTPRDFVSKRGGQALLQAEQRFGAARANLDVGYRERETDSSVFFFGSTFATVTDVGVWNVAPRLRLPFSLAGMEHALVLGLDWDDWDYDSHRDFGPARILASQSNRAVYAQDTVQVSAATRLVAGLRQQRVEYDARDAQSGAPYAGGEQARTPHAWEVLLRHDFAARLAAYGRVGRSFRVATVDEIYNQFGGPAFDPIVTFLEPQTSHDAELGLEFGRGGLGARAALYRMDLDNEIRFNPVTFTNENLPPTRRRGVELEARWNPMPRWEISGNYTWADAEFRGGVLGGVALAGNTVPLVPAHKANLAVAWRPVPRALAAFSVSWIGEQYYDGDEANSFGRKMPAYAVANLKARYDLGAWRLTAGVTNLFDEKYYSYGLVIAPGVFVAYPQAERAFFASAEYLFR